MSWEEFFLHPWLGMHQPLQHPVAPHHPLTQTRSQPNMRPSASPYRNFLHDENMLNQPLFNAFSPSGSTNPTYPPPHPFPRSYSTGIIPTYKIDSAGNIVPNPNPTIPTNPILNKNPTDKKSQRHSVTFSGVPTPSSLPTNPSYPLSASPPKYNPPTTKPVNTFPLSSSPTSNFVNTSTSGSNPQFQYKPINPSPSEKPKTCMFCFCHLRKLLTSNRLPAYTTNRTEQ